MAETYSRDQVLGLTAQIVSAHVAHNSVPSNGLPALITTVYATLASAGADIQAPQKLEPAVPIRNSVFPDYIVCLEDGKKLKMLKRHLKTAYQLTPEQYRERWGLPASYPMVAPNYAKHRSTLAKKIGLGQKSVGTAPPPAAKPATRGRKPGRPAADR